MGCEKNSTVHEFIEIEVKNTHRLTVFDLHLQHLVKVTIIEFSIIYHADKRSTHDTVDSGRIECVNQLRHIIFVSTQAF